MAIKELEKFTRYFVCKAFMIIVDSRLGGPRIKTICNPEGNDWFNIALQEIKEVSDRSKIVLDNLKCSKSDFDVSGFNIESDWRLCCEILLKNSEDKCMTLEYWFIENMAMEQESDPLANSPSSTARLSSLAIYNVYNKMSLLLKTLVTLTRCTPAHNISTSQGPDSHVICYRIYQTELSFDQMLSGQAVQGDKDHFTTELKLGSVKSSQSVLNISFAHRTDMSTTTKSDSDHARGPILLPLKNDHFINEAGGDKTNGTKHLPAFANHSPRKNLCPLLPEAPFAKLLEDEATNCESVTKPEVELSEKSLTISSNPISIPNSDRIQVKEKGSPYYSSSAESFVFVELKAPFASDDQRDLGSFFNGPSPSFKKKEIADDLLDISNQLAALESNKNQWDSFIDSVCCPDNEDAREKV